jgi:hypothetical protein
VKEAAGAPHVLHVGDSLRGDYLNPRAHGWRAMLWPIPDAMRAERQADHAACVEDALAGAPARPRRGDCGMKTWTPKATDAKRADLLHHIGYDLLGPVVQRWLLALHQHLEFHDDGDTVALFCARAGVRIAELYDLFLQDRCATGPPMGMFWISRLAVAKGVFGTPGGQHPSIDLLTREYRHLPLRDLVTGLMRQCPDLLSDIDLRDRALDAHGHNFAGWLTVNGPVQRRVREFLRASTAAFETYVDDLLDGSAPRPPDRQRVAGHDTKPPDIRTSRYHVARPLFRSHPDA